MPSPLNIVGYIGIAACGVCFIVFGKHKPRKSVLAGVCLSLAVFITAAVFPQPVTDKAPAAISSGSVLSKASASSALIAGGQPFHAEFVGGYYTPGIDFPAGTYTLTAVAGTKGTVYVTNPSGAGKYYRLSASSNNTLKNISLPLGESISVTGLKIKIESSSADKTSLSERENTATKKVMLSPGRYTAGLNFEEGVYDIIAEKGSGSVESDSEGAPLHETLSAQGEDYKKEFKNLTLDNGTVLTVKNVSIELVPSK